MAPFDLTDTAPAAWTATVLPAPPVNAVVRHGDLPAAPPDGLRAHVELTEVAGQPSWVLRTHAAADAPTVSRFVDWRAGWERVWRLEPTSSVLRMCTLARSLADSGQLRGVDMIDVLAAAAAADTVVDPSMVAKARTFAVSLRKRLAKLPDKGYGFVDATPDTQRVGLARTWAPTNGLEVLAASGAAVVAMHPELGLTLGYDRGLVDGAADPHGDERGRGHVVADPTRDEVIAGIEHVEVGEDTVLVHARTGAAELPLRTAAPLTWVLPGAGTWRVRRIPLGVVWAQTLAGLEDASRYATTLSRAILLVSQRPDAAVSAPRAGT
jgi:hypothetical protein